ncbi:MAG: T9SS type A sorting domain-containing protein [Calditrichia bacterium]
MRIFTMLIVLSLALVMSLNAQTVSTFAGPGIGVNDDIIQAADGTIYGSNYSGTYVYKITTSGDVTEYMGGFNAPNGLAFDADSNLVVLSNLGNRIYKVMPDSTKIQFGANITSPSGVIEDPLSDTLYVTQYTQNNVVKMAPDGSYTPFLSGPPLNGPVGLTWDENNVLFIANYNDGKIFRVNGTTLTEIADIPGTNAGAVGFLEYGEGMLYATGIGVHRIYQVDPANGNTSILAGSGIAGIMDGPAANARFNFPNGILFDKTDNSLYTSGFQSRAIRHITGIITGITLESNDNIVEGYELDQNYPNPFNPSTTIRFRIPSAEAVQITLYDMSGREITTLLSQNLASGEHSLTFDAENLSSGVYVYRLQAGSYQATKKMMLLK